MSIDKVGSQLGEHFKWAFEKACLFLMIFADEEIGEVFFEVEVFVMRLHNLFIWNINCSL